MDNYMISNHNDIIPYAENLLKEQEYGNKITSSLPFLPTFLNQNIGRWIKVEHLIGDKLIEHIGQLINVGMDYIVLKVDGELLSTIVCNTKDIKFITVIYSKNLNYLNGKTR
ncbi:MAG: hypothetical protein U0M42_07215 [Acutalibacteraceae bacterium]|nr:hypothetical protein [Acutalibacteraceae bacterium]